MFMCSCPAPTSFPLRRGEQFSSFVSSSDLDPLSASKFEIGDLCNVGSSSVGKSPAFVLINYCAWELVGLPSADSRVFSEALVGEKAGCYFYIVPTAVLIS